MIRAANNNNRLVATYRKALALNGGIPVEALDASLGEEQTLQSTIELYHARCLTLRKDFIAIIEVYQDYQNKKNRFSGLLNRYLFNQAHPYSLFTTTKAQAFIAVLDSLTLIDDSGLWLTAVATQMASTNAFTYAEQRQLLSCLCAFFDDLQNGDAAPADPELGAAEPLLRGAMTESLINQLTALKTKIAHLSHVLVLPDQLLAHDDAELKPYHWNPDAPYTPLSLEQQAEKTTQYWNEGIAIISASIIAIGEAFIATSGIRKVEAVTQIFTSLLTQLLIGSSALYINYLLFKGDIRSFLDAFRIQKTLDGTTYSPLFLKDGRPLPLQQVRAIEASVVACAVVGFVFASLSFASTQAQLPDFLADMGYSGELDATTLAIAALVPAAGSFLGFTAIFFKVIAIAIKNDELSQLFAFLNQQWQQPHLVPLASMAVSLAITGAMAWFSYPIYYRDTLALLDSWGEARLNGTNVLPFLASAATILNDIVSALFQIKTTYTILTTTFNRETLPAPASALQKDNHTVQQLKQVQAFIAGMLNGLGQGLLFMLKDSPALAGVSFIIAWAFSFFPNIHAALSGIDEQHQYPPGTHTPSLPALGQPIAVTEQPNNTDNLLVTCAPPTATSSVYNPIQ